MQAGEKYPTYPFEWDRFVSRNTTYYLKIFRDYDNDGMKESWNWAAALFGVGWFAYRKMYKTARAFFFLIIAIETVQIIIIANSIFFPISVILELALFLYFGATGNHKYYLHVNRKITEIKGWEDKNAFLIDWYTKIGGTSIFSAIGFCLAMGASAVIIILVVLTVLH
jgi:hypothetical protein